MIKASFRIGAATFMLLSGCVSPGQFFAGLSPGGKHASNDDVAIRSAAEKVNGRPAFTNGTTRSPSPPVAANGQLNRGTAATREKFIAENLDRGVQYEQMGRLGEARVAYERVLEQDPEDSKANHRLATIADREGRFREADYHYLTALKHSPHDSNLLSDLGYSLLLQGKYDASEGALQDALKTDPNHRGAISNLGTLYAIRGEEDRSLTMFRMVGTEAEAQAALAQAAQQVRPVQVAADFNSAAPPNPFQTAQGLKAAPAGSASAARPSTSPVKDPLADMKYENEATKKIAADIQRMREEQQKSQAAIKDRAGQQRISAPTPWNEGKTLTNNPPSPSRNGMTPQQRRDAALAALQRSGMHPSEINQRMAQIDSEANLGATRANQPGRIGDPQNWPYGMSSAAGVNAGSPNVSTAYPRTQAAVSLISSQGANAQTPNLAQTSPFPQVQGNVGNGSAPRPWPGSPQQQAGNAVQSGGLIQASGATQTGGAPAAAGGVFHADWQQTHPSQVVHADGTAQSGMYGDPNASGQGAISSAWDSARMTAAQAGLNAGTSQPFPVAGNLQPMITTGAPNPAAISTAQPLAPQMGAGLQFPGSVAGAQSAAPTNSLPNWNGAPPANLPAWNGAPPAKLPNWNGTPPANSPARQGPLSQGNIIPSPSIPSSQSTVYGAPGTVMAPNMNSPSSTWGNMDAQRQIDQTRQAELRPQIRLQQQHDSMQRGWDGANITPQAPPTSFPQAPTSP